jgi:iron complex transport system substrate-binding protein
MARASLIALTLLAGAMLASCTAPPPAQPPALRSGKVVPLLGSDTLRIVERDGYRIVDLQAAVIQWGGGASGPKQFARLVLVPRGATPPPLTGDLAGATLLRTPVERIAVNMGPHEAMLTALGVEDRLVAVGGTFSWNDAIRAQVKSGKLPQIGYGWHLPPAMDVLLAAQPDVFVMAMGDVDHVKALDRIRAMGVTVVPTFLDAETSYMGRVDYLRLMGLLTGREQAADALIAEIASNVNRLKALVATQPRRSMMWAWFGGGDRWGATVRNIEAGLVRDAGGINVLERPDDPASDAMVWLSTEQMLAKGNAAQCWILRDDHSAPFKQPETLARFRAWRDGCAFSITGRMKPEVNAYDYYEQGAFRVDWVLADLVAMLHPELGVRAGTYIRPDGKGMLGQ